MRFSAELELHGKTATGVQVPDEVVDGLGAGGHPAVVATIGGYSYRSAIAKMGGRYLLPLSADVRKGAGVAAGDVLDVDVVVDDQPRTTEVPDDLAAAMDAAGARTAFDALSPSRRKAHVVSVDGAKTAETRERRIAKVVTDLGG